MNDSTLSPLDSRVIALAALAHIAWMVHALSRHGECDERMFDWLTGKLFVDGEPVAAWSHAVCLRTLKRQLRGEFDEHAKTIMGYMMGMLTLEKRLSRQPEMLQVIAQRLQRIAGQKDFFGPELHENTIAAIAGLYEDSVSTLRPRIIIHGKKEFIHHSSNRNRVRTLLLVGLRAAWLWRQHGGNHFRLIIERNNMLKAVESLQLRAVDGGGTHVRNDPD